MELYILFFWMAFYAVWIISIIVFLGRLYWSKWQWERIITLAVIAFFSSVVYSHLPESPITPEENPEAYEILLLQLRTYYAEKGYKNPIQLHLYRHSSLDEGHPVRTSMEALNISCLLYVHDRWGKQQQPGLLIAGNPQEEFGNAVVKSYKLVDGQLLPWPASERTRGPVLYQGRKSFLRGGGLYCSNSG